MSRKSHTYQSLKDATRDAPSLVSSPVPRTISDRFHPEAQQELEEINLERQQVDQTFSSTRIWTPSSVHKRNQKKILQTIREVRIQSDEVKRLLSSKRTASQAQLESLDSLSEDVLQQQFYRLEEARKVLHKQYDCIQRPDDVVDEFASSLGSDQSSTPTEVDEAFIRFINTRLYGKESSGVRKEHRKKTREYYGCYRKDSESEWKWCHATGQWLDDNTNVVLSHIIPHKMRNVDLGNLLGSGYGGTFIDSGRNGLSLLKIIERYFDNGDILIIPSKDRLDLSGLQEFKLVVIDKALLNRRREDFIPVGTWTGDWNDIDGKKLEFVPGNNGRPSLTALWLRFAIRFLLANELEKEKIKSAFTTKSPYWYSPITGKRALLVKLADKFHTSFSELNEISGKAIAPEDDGEQDPVEQDIQAEIIYSRLRD